MSIFGHDYQGRKNLPVFTFLTEYFPKALVEMVKVCVAGNIQHNKDLAPADIHWSRDKSTDQLNTALRHMMDHVLTGPFDEEPSEVQVIIGGRTRHLAKAAWRIMAELELSIERENETRLNHRYVLDNRKSPLDPPQTQSSYAAERAEEPWQDVNAIRPFIAYTPPPYELPVDPTHD